MALTFLSPAENSLHSLMTEAQKRFLSDTETRATIEPHQNLRWYALEKEGDDFSLPEGITFIWEDTDDNIAFCGFYELYISEYPDMRDALLYRFRGDRATVYNFKIGCDYYAVLQNPLSRTPVLHFRTADETPRSIRIPDISNVRDAGGYRVPGGRIRQGLVYRGGEFELHMDLAPEGGEELRRLGIRTELDMRGEAIGRVLHGVAESYGVRRISIPMRPYGELFCEESKENTLRFFSYFADASLYPLYYHCWGGADRTGCASFLLGALIGLTESDLVDEYEYTSLSIWGIRSRNLNLFVDFRQHFDALPGETPKEKAEYYFLRTLGMPAKTVDTIRSILIEKDEDM